jgi:8-oxo-dGTP diphosphatase
MQNQTLKQATLCYCLKDNRILLGLKKRGFGQGKRNGYGGKLDTNETPEQCMVRELEEESGMVAQEKDLNKVAEIIFHFNNKPDWDMIVHTYILTKWDNEPIETEEMKPEWYDAQNIPYELMWLDDKYWLADALDGKKIKATFWFESPTEIQKMHIEFVKELE